MQAALTLSVAFLAAPLDAAAQRLLAAMKTDADDFHVNGREMYWLCTRKQTESKFSNARFERALKLSATFRGLNTIARLAEKYSNLPRPSIPNETGSTAEFRNDPRQPREQPRPQNLQLRFP